VSYLDFTDAALKALTVERRRERLLTLVMMDDPPPGAVEAAYKRLHGRPYRPWTPTIRANFPAIRARCKAQRQALAEARKAQPRRGYVKPPSRSHGLLAERIFRTLWTLQAGRCYLCDQGFAEHDWATRDHVTPASKGGEDAGNILLTHSACNNAKADRGPTACERLYLAHVNDTWLDGYAKAEADAWAA